LSNAARTLRPERVVVALIVAGSGRLQPAEEAGSMVE
jgi:hypothetical protein